MPTLQPPRNGVAFSEAYAEAMAHAPIARAMLATYELRHPAFTDDAGHPAAIRIVNDHADLVATLESDAPMDPGATVTFVALPVEVSGPDEDDSGSAPTISISIDGVSQLVVQQLDAALLALDPVTITERIYASDDTTGPAVSPVMTMTLREVMVTDTQVTAKALFYDPSNRSFPRREYTLDAYPGLTAR
jgi:Domain of unknown function (DUF1833)